MQEVVTGRVAVLGEVVALPQVTILQPPPAARAWRDPVPANLEEIRKLQKKVHAEVVEGYEVTNPRMYCLKYAHHRYGARVCRGRKRLDGYPKRTERQKSLRSAKEKELRATARNNKKLEKEKKKLEEERERKKRYRPCPMGLQPQVTYAL